MPLLTSSLPHLCGGIQTPRSGTVGAIAIGAEMPLLCIVISSLPHLRGGIQTPGSGAVGALAIGAGGPSQLLMRCGGIALSAGSSDPVPRRLRRHRLIPTRTSGNAGGAVLDPYLQRIKSRIKSNTRRPPTTVTGIDICKLERYQA